MGALNLYMGIDPGQTGGVVVLTAAGDIVLAEKFDGESQGAPLGSAVIAARKIGTIAFVALEKVGAAPGQGVASMFNFGQGVGNIKGWLQCLQQPYVEVHPLAWQRVTSGSDGSAAKDRARSFVERRWGLQAFVSKGCRTPHAGLIDAACMAEHSRLTLSRGEEIITVEKRKRRPAIKF